MGKPSISDYMECQFKFTPFLTNIRYIPQINCLIKQYIKYKKTQTPNAVTLFYYRSIILILVLMKIKRQFLNEIILNLFLIENFK